MKQTVAKSTKPYIVIRTHLAHLEDLVSKHIEWGYKPYGGVVIDDGWYIQVVIKGD